jgi:hypothetical protein
VGCKVQGDLPDRVFFVFFIALQLKKIVMFLTGDPDLVVVL